MLSPMIVRLPAVAVVAAVALPMAVATVVAVELQLRCAPTRATAVLALQPRPPCVQRQQLLLWRKWLPNRLLRPLLLSRRPLSRRCLQAVPVVVVQRPADLAKTPLILLISPIGSLESVGFLISGWS